MTLSDIGYGNYLLTAPVERNQRQMWNQEGQNKKNAKMGEKAAKSAKIKENPRTNENDIIDVSELLSSANTLTNPLNPTKKRQAAKNEL